MPARSASLRALVAAIALTCSAMLALAQAASAGTLVQAPITIDVSMRVTVDETFESIDKCTPGENGKVSYTYDYESDTAGVKGGIASTKLSLVNGEGGSGYSVGEKNGAVETGKAGAWELSLDDCNSDTDVQAPGGVSSPTCKGLKGKVKTAISLTPPEEDDAGLTPLTGGDGTLQIQRSGGGRQNKACVRLFQNTKSTVADDGFQFAIGSSANGGTAPGTGDLFLVKLPALGAGLQKVYATKTLKKAQWTKKFQVSGPCYAMRGQALQVGGDASTAGNVGPVFGIPRFETCSVTGKGVVVIRRAGKVTRTTIPS